MKTQSVNSISTAARRAVGVAALTLLAAGLSAGASAQSMANGAGQRGGPMMQAMDGGHGMHGGGGMRGGKGAGGGMRHVLDAAGASDEQRTKVRAIMQAAMADLKPLRDTAKANRQQMSQLLSAATIDANAVEAARQRNLAQHDAVSRRMTQAMVDAANVLTPEQRAKAATQMAAQREMMQRHRGERESMMGGARR